MVPDRESERRLGQTEAPGYASIRRKLNRNDA